MDTNFDTQPPAATSDLSARPKVREQCIRGIRYLYEDYPYWDRYKQQMRHRRFYIGHYESEFIFKFSKPYIKRRNENLINQLSVFDDVKVYSHQYIGATYLLDQIANKTGVFDDLKSIFPDNYLQILSLAYYMVIEDSNALYKYPAFAKKHVLPFQNNLSSQRISELLSSIDDNSMSKFFVNQTKRRIDDEYFAYDITSISSYSKNIELVKYGHNKDDDNLAQVNIAIIVGEKSLLPVYYRILPGNINDVTTIKKFILDTQFLNLPNLKFVMDRGFYSSENISELHQNGYKFVMGIKTNIKFISKQIEDIVDILDSNKYYSADHDVCCTTKTTFINLKNISTVHKQSEKSKFRLFIHIYYDSDRAASDKKEFRQKIHHAIKNINQGTASKDETKFLAKYSTYIPQNNNKFTLDINNELIDKKESTFGYFALVSNYVSDPVNALTIYRDKDFVEKAFYSLKNRLHLTRTSVHSTENLEGFVFIKFIALILTSYIHKQMKTSLLYSKYTMYELLAELDIISLCKYSNNKSHFSEITSKQVDIYKLLNIEPIN
jgi:transposase